MSLKQQTAKYNLDPVVLSELEALKDKLVTVCSECERVCCWHGEFMCDEAYGASTKDVPVHTIVGLTFEHPQYALAAALSGNETCHIGLVLGERESL